MVAEDSQAFEEVSGTTSADEAGNVAPVPPGSMMEEKVNNDVKKALSGCGLKVEEKVKVIPSPGTGVKIYAIEPFLKPYHAHLDYRYGQYKKIRELIDEHEGGLDTSSRGYEKFGFNRRHIRFNKGSCCTWLINEVVARG